MNTLITNERTFIPFTQTDGIYVLPQILSAEHITEIYKVSKIKASHHGDDDGHGSGGRIGVLNTPFKAEKPYNLPWVADLISKHIPKSVKVDPNVQIYTLPDGGGIVPLHIDQDFQVDGLTARYSVLIYLNDAYTGGETVFNRNMFAPKVPVGAGLVFRHNILHEGLKVTSGEKHVLKTDLFTL